MIWGQYDDFEIWYAEKWDLPKTCSARPQTCVLCTFHGNRTVFPIWWWFEASTTISKSGMRKGEILSKLAPQSPKRAFCALFLQIALFPDLPMIWGQLDDFVIWFAEKWDFAKTCSARLKQCDFHFSLFRTPDFKIVVLASNHRQILKTVRFLREVRKTHVWGFAEQVLPKSHFSAHQISKSSNWPQTFAAVRSKFWRTLSFPHSRCQNRRTGLKSSTNR